MGAGRSGARVDAGQTTEERWQMNARQAQNKLKKACERHGWDLGHDATAATGSMYYTATRKEWEDGNEDQVIIRLSNHMGSRGNEHISVEYAGSNAWSSEDWLILDAILKAPVGSLTFPDTDETIARIVRECRATAMNR
jgi:hypothetical protein